MTSSTHAALASIPRPSVARRAALAGLLLVVFVVSTLGVAITLLVLPIAVFWLSERTGRDLPRESGWLVAIAWSCAGLLFLTLARMFRKGAPLPGRVLAEAEAPALFEEVRALCAAVGIAPPAEIRLTSEVQLAVVEDRGHKVLMVGAPALWRASVGEIRAGLAHEMGHFAFGDTRFGRIYGAVGALFRGAFQLSANRRAEGGIFGPAAAGLLDALVTRYARFYCTVTRPTDRQMELAADELAVRLVGAKPLGDLLQRMSVEGPLYQIFLLRHFVPALAARALPSDRLAVFSRFLEHAGQATLVEEVARFERERPTDPFDAHPALRERLEAAQRVEAAAGAALDPRADETPARSLVALDLDAALVEMFLTAHRRSPIAPPITSMPFTALARDVYAPRIVQSAHAFARALAPAHPHANSLAAHFVEVVGALHQGKLEAFATHVRPGIAQLAPHLRGPAVVEVAATAIAELFTAALIERGWWLEEDLEDGAFVCLLGEERVRPATLAHESMKDATSAAELSRWASRLAA